MPMSLSLALELDMDAERQQVDTRDFHVDQAARCQTCVAQFVAELIGIDPGMTGTQAALSAFAEGQGRYVQNWQCRLDLL